MLLKNKDENGVWIQDKEAAKDYVVGYFSKFFNDDHPAPADCVSEFPMNICPEFPTTIWDKLTTPFTKFEIRN